jgi:hypothetical protein
VVNKGAIVVIWIVQGLTMMCTYFKGSTMERTISLYRWHTQTPDKWSHLILTTLTCYRGRKRLREGLSVSQDTIFHLITLVFGEFTKVI